MSQLDLASPVFGGIPSCQVFDGIKLKAHQKNIATHMSKAKVRGALCWFSTGSGKSISALTVARCLKLKTIMVMPGAVISSVYRDIDRIDEFKALETVGIDVMTYGTFINYALENPKLVSGKLVILDEVQNFRSAGEETYKMIYAVSKAKKVLLLSATPLQNEPADIVAALCMMDEVRLSSVDAAGAYYKSKLREFNEALAEYEENDVKLPLVELLKSKVSYFQAKSPDADINYPNVKHITKKIDMTRDYYKAYEKIENNIRTGLPKQFRSSKDLSAFFNGLRRGSNHINKLSPKIKEIIRLALKLVARRHKVVIYSAFQDSGISLIRKALRDKKINSVSVTGEETLAQKGASVNAYNANEVGVMLLTAAGAAGIDLKGSRALIITEPHWNSQLLHQVYGRVVRYQSHTHLPESQQNVRIYTFILRKPAHIREQKGLSKIDKTSIDELVLSYANAKDARMNNFYKLLKTVSV